MRPVVSIVIPCYNQAHYLSDALHSVLGQTFTDWDVIIVNDGSTDNTAEIVSQFTDPRIRYIYQENQGLGGARNSGIQAAQGEMIALLDSDDVWEPKYLEEMLDRLNGYSEAAAVYCGIQHINSRGQPLGKPSVKNVRPEAFHQTIIYEGNWLIPGAVIFRKKLADEVGLFDESLLGVEDTDLWLRLSDRHVFVGLPKALVRYRLHDTNMSKDPQHMVTGHRRLVEKRYGPPEGDVLAWSEPKKHAYARLAHIATWRYLAYGDIQKSAHYFQKLVEISPRAAMGMRLWRDLARIQLPVEQRNDPSAQIDLALAQRDISGLLGELALRASYSTAVKEWYSRIRGSALLALAEEAVRANNLRGAYRWLWQAAVSCPRLLLARPYWGTISRSMTRIGNKGC
jgi:glycosyltransferase involved in cell wall biosynthesis